MIPLESFVLRYVSTHPNTRRKTVVDALGAEAWDTQRRVRNTLDLLHAKHLLIRTGSTKREYRCTATPTKIERTF
jgi:hypothetical protein